MKRSTVVSSIALACTGLLAGGRLQAQLDSQLQENMAQQKAEAWLSLIDKKDYDTSWEQASTSFQRSITRDQWRAGVARLRGPEPKLVSRTFTARQYNETLLGALPGPHVVISYQTDFQDRKGLAETVTTMLDGSRGWRVAGYMLNEPRSPLGGQGSE